MLYHRIPMMRGDDVAELQARLNSLGFDTGKVDGIFGPDTLAGLLDSLGEIPPPEIAARIAEQLRALQGRVAPGTMEHAIVAFHRSQFALLREQFRPLAKDIGNSAAGKETTTLGPG